jgi:plastocyanin
MRTRHVAPIAVLVLAAAGCGGDNNGPSASFTVEVTPATASVFTLAPGNTVTLAATAKNGAGQTLTGGTKSFTSGNNAVATVDASGKVTGVGAGTTAITATITIDGATESATSTVTVAAAPAVATVTAPALTFNPTASDIRAGGSVTWSIADVHHSIVFTSAGAPADIGELLNASESRTFPTNGTYSYTCGIHPSMSGTVRVH